MLGEWTRKWTIHQSIASTWGHFFSEELEMAMIPPTLVGYASEKLLEMHLFFWMHGISGKWSRPLQIRRVWRCKGRPQTTGLLWCLKSKGLEWRWEGGSSITSTSSFLSYEILRAVSEPFIENLSCLKWPARFMTLNLIFYLALVTNHSSLYLA